MTEQPSRPLSSRPPFLGPILVAAVVAFAAGGGAALWWRAHSGPPSIPRSGSPVGPAVGGRSQPPAPVAAAPASAPAASPVAPSFDIVRIAPGGHAVIAGRAAPGAEVTVRSDGRSLGSARADSSGNWLLLPDRTLPPGPARLTLSARLPGGTTLAGSTALSLNVPAPAGAGEAGTPGGGAGAVASATGAPVPPASASRASLASAGAGSSGTPADRAAHAAPGRRGAATMAVRPGQSLWGIARQHYGKGKEYPVIYQANRAQIAEPNIIYPGQKFDLPPLPRQPAATTGR